MTLKGLLGAQLQRLVSAASAKVREHLTVDLPNRRVHVSDAVVLKAIRTAATKAAVDLVEVVRVGGGYDCTWKKGDETLRCTAIVTELVWGSETFEVTVATPEGVELTSRPVLSAIVAGMVGLIGGTAVADFVLSAPLPAFLRWDGKTALLAFPSPAKGKVQTWLGLDEVAFEVAQDASGLWFKVSDDLTLLRFIQGLLELS